jgi:hypothetical protein
MRFKTGATSKTPSVEMPRYHPSGVPFYKFGVSQVLLVVYPGQERHGKQKAEQKPEQQCADPHPQRHDSNLVTSRQLRHYYTDVGYLRFGMPGCTIF